jgi:hypothetical protein
MRVEWMVGLAPLLAAALLAFAHCSGSSSGVVVGANGDSSMGGSGGSGGGSGSSSGSGGSSGGSSSSGSGSSGGSSNGGGDDGGGGTLDGTGGASDGGSETTDSGSESGGPVCEAPEGGVACDPGIVPCGDAACVTSTSACCQTISADGGTQSCEPNSVSCPNNGIRFQCNEQPDCPSGFVCCEQFPGIAVLGPTSCMQSCNGANSTYQICRSNGECGKDSDSGALKKCVFQTCTSPVGRGGGTGRSVTLEACAVAGTSNNGALPYCTAQ